MLPPYVTEIVNTPVVERENSEIELTNSLLPFQLQYGDILRCNSNESAHVKVSIDGIFEVQNDEEFFVDCGNSYYYYARR